MFAAILIKVEAFFEFLLRNIVGIVVSMFLLLFIFWSIGYFVNATQGIKFDLKSCWDGVSVIAGTGVVGFTNMVINYTKEHYRYRVDSELNSEPHKPPESATKNEVKE